MPFKSQAQRRKFAQLLVEGKISNETFEEWNRETGAKRLPERVRRKARTAKKSAAKIAANRCKRTLTRVWRVARVREATGDLMPTIGFSRGCARWNVDANVPRRRHQPS
jgi:hypothetical protein